MTDQTEILSALEDARALLAATTLPLSTTDVLREREDVGRAVAQLDDYVLPRVRSLDAPLLAVVGGSTGAGKSTLVNSLMDRPVSVSAEQEEPPGSRHRPTTETAPPRRS